MYIYTPTFGKLRQNDGQVGDSLNYKARILLKLKKKECLRSGTRA